MDGNTPMGVLDRRFECPTLTFNALECAALDGGK